MLIFDGHLESESTMSFFSSKLEHFLLVKSSDALSAFRNLVGKAPFYGREFAFEPDPGNCVVFNTTMIRNHMQRRVELVEAAVWSSAFSEGVPFKRGGSIGH
jgi:hypothetical protein